MMKRWHSFRRLHIIGAHGRSAHFRHYLLLLVKFLKPWCWQWYGHSWKRREDSLSHQVPRIRHHPCDDQLLSLVEITSEGTCVKTLASQKPLKARALAAPTRRIPRLGGWVRFLRNFFFLINPVSRKLTLFWLSYFIENIRAAPPRSDEWWTAESNDIGERYDQANKEDEGFETILPSSSIPSGEKTKFRNCGLETWLQAREEWKRRTVETLPPKPTPAERNIIARGLIKHSAERTYELPRKMALSDLIEVYTDIWEGQGN